jgi:flagellar protein FlaG
MVDGISSGTTAPPTPGVVSTSPRVEANSRQEKLSASAALAVKEPDVEITEVANRAATEKEHSIESLTTMSSELRDAIVMLNDALEKTPTKAIITRDEQLNRFIVRIADAKSGEVVKEIPSEALLSFARNLQELKGLIFDASL